MKASQESAINIIAFISTLLIALFLRLYRLSSNPVSLNQDEAVNGYDAYSLMMTTRDHHGNFMPVMLQSFDDWASSAITYLTIPFVKVLGLSEFSIRLPIALLGVGAVILIYILTVQLFNSKKLGLLASFLLAIMPWHITLSRWAIPPSIVPFFLLLFVITFLWAVRQDEERRGHKLILVALSAAVLTYSYPTQKMFVPLFLAAISLVFLRKNFTKLAIVWASYIVFVAPIYIITLSNPSRYNARFAQVSIISPETDFFKTTVRFLLRYFRYFLPDFNFGLGSRDVIQHVPGFGSTYGFLSVFFYVGILTCIAIALKQESSNLVSRKTSLLLLAWLLIAPIPASLTLEYHNVLRTVHGLTLVILLIVLGVLTIVHSLNNPQTKKNLTLAVIILGLFNAVNFSKFYFREYPELSKETYQYGIKDFTSYVQKKEDEFTKIVIDSQINQPYIYYLFYSKYDPRLINFSDIEPSNRNKKIGKYEFRNITEQDLRDSKEVYRVEDLTRVWYRVYAKANDSLLVKRNY